MILTQMVNYICVIYDAKSRCIALECPKMC